MQNALCVIVRSSITSYFYRIIVSAFALNTEVTSNHVIHSPNHKKELLTYFFLKTSECGAFKCQIKILAYLIPFAAEIVHAESKKRYWRRLFSTELSTIKESAGCFDFMFTLQDVHKVHMPRLYFGNHVIIV